MIRKHSNLGLIFAILVWLFSVGKVSAQISDLIYNPHNLWAIGEDKIIVNDIADNEHPIKLFDFSNDSLLNSLRSGRGPGEVTSTSYKRLTKFSNGDLLLWDSGMKRIMRYSSNLEYKTDVRGDSFSGSFFQAGLINDSTLWTVGFTEDFLKVWRINDNRISENSLLWSINIKEYEELYPLSNFLLLQTLFYSNYRGTLYITFEFASLVMAINEEDIVFINNEPANIPLPPVDEESQKSGRYSLPIMGKHPEGARDVSVTDEFVYVLLNGETISKLKQLRYITNFETLIDKVNHAERLLMYDRITGDFVEEIKLPIPARQAKVQNDYVYLLNSLGDVPVIKKYKLSEL